MYVEWKRLLILTVTEETDFLKILRLYGIKLEYMKTSALMGSIAVYLYDSKLPSFVVILEIAVWFWINNSDPLRSFFFFNLNI